MAKECSTFGCWYPVFSKGLCQTHWRQIYGKPIARFSTLKQTTDSKPAKPFKVGKPIPKFSDKMAARLKEYRKKRDVFLKGKTCDYPGCSESKNLDLHHQRGRVGELLTDVRFFKALCRKHHIEIENNPEAAKELKLSDSRLATTY